MSSAKKFGTSKSSSPTKVTHPHTLPELHAPQANIDIHPGDRVEYHPIGNSSANVTTGEVVSIVTERTHVGKRHFNATPEDPRVMIRNDKTHKRSGYKVEHVVGYAPPPEDEGSEKK